MKHKRILITAIFLASHLLFAFWRPFPMWGVDFLAYLPGWTTGVFVLSSLLLLGLIVWQGRFLRFLDAFPRWIDPMVVILVGLVFVGLRSSVHLLGDGYLVLRELSEGILHRSVQGVNAPLAFWMVESLHMIRGVPPETAYRVYSWVAGVFYLILACVCAQRLGKGRAEHTLILGMLMTPGLIQLFCGYAETYAFLFPIFLFYLLSGLLSLQGQSPLWGVVVLLGFLIPFHFALVTLVPSLALLVWMQTESRSTVNRLVQGIVYCGLSLGVAAVVLVLIDFDFAFYIASSKSTHLLPLWGGSDFVYPYGLFSVGHGIDVLNLYLLVAPGALMGFFLVGRWGWLGESEDRFLFVATLFPILFTLLAHPGIGGFRDWDAFSYPALPLSLWVGLRLARGRFARVGWAICGVSALHTLFWVGTNASPVAAEARFEALLTRSYLSGEARGYGWETLAGLRESEGRLEQALEAQKQALKASPKNPRYWGNVGRLTLTIGRSREALSHFQKALEVKPDQADTYSNMGKVYYMLGDYAGAVRSLQKALVLDPDLPEAHTNLGVTYQAMGRYEDALLHHQRALGSNSQFVEAHSNIGNTYHQMGQYEIAVHHLQTALTLRPDYAKGYANLGNAWMAQGRFQMAVPHLEKALVLDANLDQARFNLGLAHLGLKQYEQAIGQFQRVIDRHPRMAKAYHSMGMAYAHLDEIERARNCYQKVLELDADYPHADTIRAWLDARR